MNMKLALWLVIASLIATIAGPAGVVLCVSESGHVEIANGSDDCCEKKGMGDRELAHSDRCTCVDTPLLRDAARSNSGTERLLSAWSALPISPCAPPLIHESIAVGLTVRFAHSVREPIALASLRSVVLLA